MLACFHNPGQPDILPTVVSQVANSIHKLRDFVQFDIRSGSTLALEVKHDPSNSGIDDLSEENCCYADEAGPA